MSSRSRRRLSALAVALPALLICGCAEDSEEATSKVTTTDVTASTIASRPTTTAESTTTSVTTTVLGSTTVPGATTAPAGATTTSAGGGAEVVDPMPDGTNFGFLRSVSVGGSTIGIDLADLLTGDAAVTAALEDGVLDPGATTVDNDYYIRNRNPKVRTAPVAGGAPVQVLADLGSADLVPGGLADLAATLSDVGPEIGVPVRVVSSAGTVTRIEQVFFP